VSAIIDNIGLGWRHALGLVSREHALSLTDQAVVSGASFLTTVAIAHWSGPSQLGIYAVGTSVLLSLLAFQDSLILQPYSIQRYYREGTTAESAGASLTLNVLFSVASSAALIVAALAFLKWHPSPEITVMTGAIAGIAPFALTRDFVRRFSFAHLAMGRAVLLDLAVAIIQLSVLSFLGANGRLSAVSACAVLGVACAIPTVLWLYYARAEFRVRLEHVRIALTQTWALGKWLLAGRAIVQVQGYITYWISIVIAGAAVTGAYAACMSIVGFLNPLMIGLANVSIPRSVLAWKNGGGPALRLEAIRNTALIAASMGAASVAVLLLGEYVMRLLYRGSEFEGLGHVVTILVLAMTAGALGLPASNALAAMERPGAIVRATTVGSLVTIALVWLLIREWGLLGAAYGSLAGGVAGTFARWIAFIACLPKTHDKMPFARALQRVVKVPDDSEITTTRIGEGEDAEVFLIGRMDRQSIWGKYDTVAAKIYKPEAPENVEMVQAQFDSLCRLHGTLDGHESDGWNISVPRPLYVCASPLALVMTAVPGKNIDSYVTESASALPDSLDDAVTAFTAAMQYCWSKGDRHGDLALNNVLFDLERKKISFLDAGTFESCRTCNGTITFSSPAAGDIGHMMYDIAVNVMDLIGNRRARMIREIFVERVLSTILQNINSQDERQRFLRELSACIDHHIADYLEVTWSLRGLRNRFIKRIAANRIHASLDRIASNRSIYTEQNGNGFLPAVQLSGGRS